MFIYWNLQKQVMLCLLSPFIDWTENLNSSSRCAMKSDAFSKKRTTYIVQLQLCFWFSFDMGNFSSLQWILCTFLFSNLIDHIDFLFSNSAIKFINFFWRTEQMSIESHYTTTITILQHWKFLFSGRKIDHFSLAHPRIFKQQHAKKDYNSNT